MSYPPASNYYGSTANATNNHQYATPGNNPARPNPYQVQARGVDDGHQSQYGAHRYGWTGQEQNATVANTQNAYSDNSWNNRSNTSNTYHYQRDMYPPSNQTTSNSQRYQSRDPYNSQNTQGLNHLAYASGLDSAASLNTSVRSSQVQSNPGHAPATTSYPHMRAASPANYDVQYSSSIPQQPVSTSQSTQSDDASSLVNNSDHALKAAAALADVVRSRQRQPNQQSHNPVVVRDSSSPMMVNAQITQQGPKQPVNSSNSVGKPATSRSKKASNNSRLTTSNATNQARAVAVNNVKNSQTTQSKPVMELPQAGTNKEQPVVQNSDQHQRAVSNPQSIANLVSGPKDFGQETHESLQEVAMPSYIDPSQVFNPYHREHERKKREAAEAAAWRETEEQRLAEEQRKASEDAMKKTLDPPTAINSMSTTSRNSSVANSTMAAPNSDKAVADASSSTSVEDTMAAEMQKMMEKMKEFRNTNPALFQKLWKDMRGNANNTTAATATKSSSPQNTRASVDVDASGPATQPANANANQKKSETHPVTNGIPPNGFKVVIENNSEGLPDLGRFPAERRIRNPYNKNKSNEPTEAAQLQDQTSSITQQAPASDHVSPTQTPRLVVDPTVAMPEPRRRAIAIAAVHILKANPENAWNPITAQQICSILEHNPPYLDLCSALESWGLRFQRTTFARELLRSVPGLSTPATKTSNTPDQKAATVDRSVTTAHQQIAPPPTIPVQIDNNHNVPHPLTNTYSSSQTGPSPSQPISMAIEPPSVKAEMPKAFSKPLSKPAKARLPPSSRPEPPIGSKEAAARKRDFSELIDLTALNDNENYVLTTKQPRLEPEQPHDPFREIEKRLRAGFTNITSITTEPLRFNPRPSAQAQTSYGLPAHLPFRQETHPNQPRVQSIAPQPQQQQQANFQQPGGKPRMVLARKLDKSEALQKSYYDPKTVARDILIASGRHPSERPLNLHLAGLIGNSIDLDSDVSTFDWDAIDPGGPPPKRVDYVDIPAAPPRYKIGERVRKRIKTTETSDADQTRAPKMESRQVGPASGTPADSLAASPAPYSLHPAFSIERDPTNLPLKVAHRQKRRREGLGLGNDVRRVTPSARKISVDIPIGSSLLQSARSASHKSVERASRMEVDATPTTKRRGRPPGSKNKYPSVAAMKQQAKAVVVEAPIEKAPEPVFHSYKCKWVKCYAELHNIDTLRRHLLKNHTPKEDEIKQAEYVCWWKKCQYLEPDGDGNMAPSQTFKNLDDWIRHVEQDHIQPIALKYGDGPRTSQTGKQKSKELDLSKFLYKPPVGPDTRTFSYTDPQSVTQARDRYLADLNGRATTPLVSSDGNSELQPDAMILTKTYPYGPKTDKEKADITAHNAFMKAHGNKHQDGRKAAEEVVRAMEMRKKKIGPGLDRGGCTLVNEARRSTFVQGPGISRIVDYEY